MRGLQSVVSDLSNGGFTLVYSMNLYQQYPADERQNSREKEREREGGGSNVGGLKEADRWRLQFHHIYRPALP
jgi:hypothetical protein